MIVVLITEAFLVLSGLIPYVHNGLPFFYGNILASAYIINAFACSPN